MSLDPAESPPAVRLAPMDLGQIVDAVVALYRTRPGLLLGICAVIQVPATVVAGLVLLPMRQRWTEAFGFDVFDPDLSSFPRDVPEPSGDALLGLVGPVWVAVLVGILAGVLMTVALTEAIHRLWLGRPTTVGGVIRAVLGRIIAALGATIIDTIVPVGLIAIGCVAIVVVIAGAAGGPSGGPIAFAAVVVLVALAVAAIFISVRWTLWPQALIVERAGPVAALGRSWRLISGSTWRVLGYSLLFGLAAAVLSGLLGQLGLIAVSAVERLIPSELGVVLRLAVEALASLLLAPIVPAAMTLLYFDLRVRHGEQIA